MRDSSDILIAEVELIGKTEGLILGAMRLDRSKRRDIKLISALARGASSRNVLITEADVEALRALSGFRFFDVQFTLCQLIPHLVATPTEMMALVSMLVELGGEGGMANEPNAAFRKWCFANDRRLEEVIISARAGDPIALRHLVFALEAKAEVEEAFRSAAADGEERTAGVLALSRITLDECDAARAIDSIITIVSTSSPTETAGLIKAALDIAGKHSKLDRTALATALDNLSASEDAHAIHLMATALFSHYDEMSEPEIASCLRGIQSVDPANIRTVQLIDNALHRLWPRHPDKVGQVIAALISNTKGQVGNSTLNRIWSADDHDQDNALVRLATEWLRDGDYYCCLALASQVSEINRISPCFMVMPDVLPLDPTEQIFICRKALGYFFLSAPMTAAAWIVAVLRRGDPAAQDVAELLFDPLLVNYGGMLKNWLVKLLDEEALGNDAIRDALQRAQEVWDGFDAAREVVELEPSSSRRALVRFQEAEVAERIPQSAREQSIIGQLMTTQTLLYGNRSSFSIRDGEGNRHPQIINLAQVSFSSELPKGLFFDPVGIERKLHVFRHEKRVGA